MDRVSTTRRIQAAKAVVSSVLAAGMLSACSGRDVTPEPVGPLAEHVAPEDFNGSEHTSNSLDDSSTMLRAVDTAAHPDFDQIVFTFGTGEGEGMPRFKASVNERDESLTITFFQTGAGRMPNMNVDSLEPVEPVETQLSGGTLGLSSTGEVPLHSRNAEVTVRLEYADTDFEGFRIFERRDTHRVILDIQKAE